MDSKDILDINKNYWDNNANEWFGVTALPTYGVQFVTENELRLFGDVSGKKMLDIGCGSGHSLKYHGDNNAAELWGLDMSIKQIENANNYLKECGYAPKLINAPMEAECGIPKDYFDFVYSIYAIGWTTDLQGTLNHIASYLKKDGIFLLDNYRRKGYGKELVNTWENNMKDMGYDILMTSTLSNEKAQHFYRKLGYKDAGSLLLENEPLEIIFTKII